MVSKKKMDETQKLGEVLKKYSVIGLLDLYKLPSRQLQFIRRALRGQVEVFMRKKCVIERSLENTKDKKDLKKLIELEVEEPALMLTNMNPVKVFKMLNHNKSPSGASPGYIAARDIIVPEGPTSLPAGPARASSRPEWR